MLKYMDGKVGKIEMGKKCTAALLECDKTSSQANGRKTACDMKTHNGEMKYVECENSKNV